MTSQVIARSIDINSSADQGVTISYSARMSKTLVTYLGACSATPREMTDPRISYRLSFPNNPLFDVNGILQKRTHIVLFYKKQSNEDLGWHVGGWMKENLGRALVNDPILAGRLRRSEDGSFEIVSNDSGVRCVEAQTTLSLIEFLESKEKHEVEAELVCWKELDEANPLFSPLFYVQVTNFQCGGFSVGISCSLLLADPLLLANFLNRWGRIHQSIAYEGEIPKVPVVYASNFNRARSSPQATADTDTYPSSTSSQSQTIMFSISTDEKLNPGDEICDYLVLQSIEEAERMLGGKMGSSFTLITKEPSGDAKAEKTSKTGIFRSPKSIKYELNPLGWEDLRTHEIAFRRENVAADVSHWITCDDLEGVVLVVISPPREAKSGMNVVITVPSERAYS